MKEIIVKKGERGQIVETLFDSVPDDFKFSVESLDSEADVSGKVEVNGSYWLFRKNPVLHELQSAHVFRKGFWDSLYTIHVIPDEDVRVLLEDNRFRFTNLILVLTGIILLGAAVSVIVSLLTKL